MIQLTSANILWRFFCKNREKRDFLKFFLEIGQNWQGRKYAHVFPWVRKHTVRVISSPWENFEFLEKTEISTCADPTYVSHTNRIIKSIKNLRNGWSESIYGFIYRTLSNLFSRIAPKHKNRRNIVQMKTRIVIPVIFSLMTMTETSKGID